MHDETPVLARLGKTGVHFMVRPLTGHDENPYEFGDLIGLAVISWHRAT